VLGLLVTVLGGPAAEAATAAVQPAGGTQPAAAAPAGAQHAAGATTVTPASLTTAGGPCSVPGIGDIGSLLGLCSSGQSGLLGDLNNICQPSLPQPEPATAGIDSIVRPPATTGPQGKTLYDNYGVAGQYWAAYGLQCSDLTSLIGNNVAGMVFDASKAVDRVTITVYQSAAGNGILSWLQNVVNRLISSLGNAIYFPYLAPVVLLGVMWLAWHGLIRKRATRTIEGTIWMVIACAAAIWLIGRPADFTGFGQSVSNGVTQVLNVAFSKLPSPGGSNCVPVTSSDPQSPGGNFGFTAGNGLVDQNANELWAVLVCKPWLDGEFGTTQYATGTGQHKTLVNTYGRQLLWAQAIAANESPSASVIKAKQAVYAGIASNIKANDPSVYPLFQGDQWTSRMEIGFAALFAALVAGVLVLLIAITLIILKLGFLLLLVAGPFFLIIGTHPGFGRVVAMRWVEMIIGVLLKQVAVALVLSVLLYCYSLIMGTSDAVLPWALKILMIALVTVAVFIYRKPFQHLFSAVGYGSIGARERAEIEMYRSRETLRRNATGVAAAAAGAAGGFAGYRVGRWSRRDPAQSASLAEHIAAAGGGTAVDAAGVAVGQHAAGGPAGHGTADPSASPDGDREHAGTGVHASSGGSGRAWAAAGVDGSARAAPPLHLPSRVTRTGEDSAAPSGWARSGAEGTAAGRPGGRAGDVPPRPTLPRVTRAASVQPRSGPPQTTAARSGGAAAPPRPAAGNGGPPPRTSAGGGGPAPAGAGTARSRWRGEAAARQAPAGRGGRPLWQPGPIRPSTGWSGGAGSRSGAAPGSAPPPPPPPAPYAAPPSRAPGAPPPAYPHTGPAAGAARPSRRSRSGDPAAAGQPGTRAASHAGPNGSGSGSGGQGAPKPFWLRPVRRKK
jgi:hypothetical protein